MSAASVRERLAAGPVRGLGCANEVAAEAVRDAAILRELVEALADRREVVLARSANALKKVQTARRDALEPFAQTILRRAVGCEVLQARWNLTIVVGGLRLQGRERALAVELMFEALGSRSVFLRVFAMQALVDLSAEDADLQRRVVRLWRRHSMIRVRPCAPGHESCGLGAKKNKKL